MFDIVLSTSSPESSQMDPPNEPHKNQFLGDLILGFVVFDIRRYLSDKKLT